VQALSGIGADFGTASSMSAMTYSGDLLGNDKKLTIGMCTAPACGEPGLAATAPFLRPGPEDLSEAIPAFFIGRNKDGFWVARDADGKSGGLFWRKESAIRFALESAWPARCATIFPSESIELDLANQGNPLLAYVAGARRLLTNRVHRLAVLARRLSRR
jgi:hypothetical protein